MVPSERSLTPALSGLISAPAAASPGQTVRVSVGTARAGESVEMWLFSTPVHLGSFIVAADGTIQVTLPGTIPTGAHRLVLATPAGEVLGWTPITIGGAPAGLAGTGAEAVLPLALVALLLLGGGLILRRRSAASAA